MHKWWSFLFGAVMTAAVLIFVVAPFANWWMPRNVSTYGGGVDALFYLILAITGFFFILTEGILVYNMCRYAEVPGEKAYYVHGNHRLEVFWTIVPAVILLLIAFLQIKVWADIKYQSSMPSPEHIIEVSARQFEWRVRYPAAGQMRDMANEWNVGRADGAKMSHSWSEAPHADDIHVVNEIHCWKNSPVRVYLKTRDVLHSFYLPNLRLKQDALPGKTIPVWFNVTESNTVKDAKTGKWIDGGGIDETTGKHKTPELVWDLACAELCGWGHYKMAGRLYVHETKDDYLDWLKQAEANEKQNKP